MTFVNICKRCGGMNYGVDLHRRMSVRERRDTAKDKIREDV